MRTASAAVKRAVPQAILDRLARLLGMVGSVHDGEALNAARLADKLLRSGGLTWFDVLAQPEPAAVSSGASLLIGWPAQWRSALRLCAQYSASLGDRERSLVQSLMVSRRKPSLRQLVWLRSITQRLIEAGGGQ